MKKSTNQPPEAIHIGNTEGSVRTAVDGIMQIISAPCGDTVKVAALEALRSVSTFNAQHVTVSNNMLTFGETKK